MKLYNSMTKRKEEFTPIQPGHISIYVCGMTVYDYCHLGHARTMVCFDVMVRYWRARGYTVNYVRNITDIDDKIIQRAHENGESLTALTERFIKALHEDQEALGILPPDAEPKATEHIDHIISLIERLIKKGSAYVGESGDVYFNVPSFPKYGRLAHKDLAGQEMGARVDLVTEKRDPLDFVLWKSAKPGEPSWESPWGPGRPGWHIECSAMSMSCLGETFDIHGGGFDLQFPHHENEIAQSEAATDKTFANVWMHVGFLQINQEKMSKSLNNFFTIRDVLKNTDAETVRYFLLSSQYRSQLNYAPDTLQQAHQGLTRLYQALRGKTLENSAEKSDFRTRFFAAMDDDFNTAEAMSVLYDLSHAVQRGTEQAGLLKELGGILGILQQDPEAFFRGEVSATESDSIENLVREREQARTNKQWARADEIRQQLLSMGIVLEDKPEGTLWRRER